MFEILKSYGVPHKVLQLIVSIYSIYIVSMYTRRLWLVSRVSVTSPDGDIVLFKLLAGILQGDTLKCALSIHHCFGLCSKDRFGW